MNLLLQYHQSIVCHFEYCWSVEQLCLCLKYHLDDKLIRCLFGQYQQALPTSKNRESQKVPHQPSHKVCIRKFTFLKYKTYDKDLEKQYKRHQDIN